MKNIIIGLLVLISVGSIATAAYFYGKIQPTDLAVNTPLVSVTPTVEVPSLTPVAVSVTPTVKDGTVTGRMCYPASILPQGKIIAKNTVTSTLTVQDYPGNQMNYTFKLSPGTYHLKYDAYVSGPDSTPLSGYYTNYSSCVGDPSGADCSGQKTRPLLPVVVESGKITSNVNLCDFYYPPESPPSF